jgi:hypothetical protein
MPEHSRSKRWKFFKDDGNWFSNYYLDNQG